MHKSFHVGIILKTTHLQRCNLRNNICEKAYTTQFSKINTEIHISRKYIYIYEPFNILFLLCHHNPLKTYKINWCYWIAHQRGHLSFFKKCCWKHTCKIFVQYSVRNIFDDVTYIISFYFMISHKWIRI